MSMRAMKIGCAVAGNSVVATTVGTRAARDTLVVDVPDGAEPLHVRIATTVANAVQSLVKESGQARVRIALIPPLAQVRHIALPPMREHERAYVLARDAGRYFCGVDGAQVVASVPAADSGILAAAVPEALLTAVSSVLPANIHVDAVVPAASAWVAGLRAPGHLRVELDDVAIRVSGKRGHITRYRQRPVHRIPIIDADTQLTGTQAGIAAASQVWLARALMLRRPEDVLRLRRQRIRRWRMAAAAGVVFLLAGAVGAYLTVKRDLGTVRSERAALRPALAPALADTDSLLVIEERLAEAGRMTGHTVWSEVLPLLAHRLNTDAHLIHVIGSRDSLALRIQAPAAADVLPELRAAPIFRQVRIAGSIERDVTDPDNPSERFDVAAVVRPREEQR